MRYLLLLLLLVGCTTPPKEPEPLNPFLAVEYHSIESLRFGPRDAASYLYGITCDYDFHATIAEISSSSTEFTYVQTYHSSPILGTNIVIKWDESRGLPTAGTLLVVDTKPLRDIDISKTLEESEALELIDAIFNKYDTAQIYEIVEPRLVYYFDFNTEVWYYAWETTIDSHHSEYDPYSQQVILTTFRYTIIIDQAGTQLLLKFDRF